MTPIKPTPQPPRDPLDAALSLYGSGRFAEALALLGDLLAARPEHVPALNLAAVCSLHSGKPGEAESFWIRALRANPNYAEGRNNLGFMLHGQKRLFEAEEEYRSALSIHPGYAEAHFNLGNLLQEQKRFEEAEAAYRSAIAIRPGYAEARNNLGNLLLARRRFDEAEAQYRSAIALRPDYPRARLNLAFMLRELKRFPEAEEESRSAVSLNPTDADAHNSLGVLLQERKCFGEAEKEYRLALSLRPDYAEGYNNLGLLFQEQDRFDEAEESYRRALALRPDSAETRYNLGKLFQEGDRFPEAEAQYRIAISLRPDYPEAHYNLASLLQGQNRLDEAEAAYRRAISLRPDRAGAYNNLGVLLREQNRFAEAEAAFGRAFEISSDFNCNLLHLHQHMCRWTERESEIALLLDAAAGKRGGNIDPFHLLSIPECGPLLQRACARRFAEYCAGRRLSRAPLHGPARKADSGRLRLGYLSADFHAHATTFLLAEVLELHDRNRFETIGYSLGPDDGTSASRRIRGAFDRLRDLRTLPAEEAARTIAADSVDILVDLKGYTKFNGVGILALRPAPVQVNWLGYPGTMGCERLADYIVGDPVVTPPSHAPFYSETLALMPHSYQPNDRQRRIAPPTTREAHGLPEKGFVFCSFNQGYKITPELFGLWARLLASLPGSVLWLLEDDRGPARENLLREAALRGISPERIIFAGRLPLADHLARLRLADLMLDTFPCTSHTTASDALWAGLPLVTRLGETFAARVAGSLLHAAGLPQLAVASFEGYFDLALDLATRPGKLAALKDRLEGSRLTCPLFDSARFTRDLERLFERMWENHLSGRKERIVLTDEPGDSNAYNNPAIPLRGRERFAEAEEIYRRAVSLAPDPAGASNSLGLLLLEQERFAGAEEEFRRAISFRPDYAEAYNNLGFLCQQQGRFPEAEETYRAALSLRPDFAPLYNLAKLFQEQGRFPEAEKAYRAALSIEAGSAEAHNNLGLLLQEQGRFPEAEEAYRGALSIKADYAEAHNNLGVLLQEQNRLAEAEAAFARAFELKSHINCNLVHLHQHMCRWKELESEVALLLEAVAAKRGGSADPFHLLSIPEASPLLQRECARQFAGHCAGRSLSGAPLHKGARKADDGRLRLGYLSGDFRSHAVSFLLAEVMELLDRKRFETIGYSCGPDDLTPISKRIRGAFDRLRDVQGLSFDAAARRIADDSVDILVDLSGYTKFRPTRILALRPATVQVNWLGYPGTMGHERLADYILGDPVVTPLSHAAFYSETLALMPHCYQPNDRQRRIGPPTTREAHGLPEKGFVFCSFNQSCKITPRVFALWSRLLNAIPGSVLWLLEDNCAAAIENLRREAALRGISPERLAFAARLPLPEHLARLSLADLMLDTFPYTSHTTASDALWVGLPLVTRLGETFAARVAGSLLHAAGLPQLVTTTFDGYFDLALDLATHPMKLAAFKDRLAEERLTCPLFDSARFTRDLERLFERIWENHLAGRKEAIVLTDEPGAPE